MEQLTWRKSQRSSDQGDACVEVARFPNAVGVRDSKDPDGAKLILSQQAFRMLIQDLASGGDSTWE
ncbi:DUF397 domain-containing protein [Actinomadura adrarensis]|uniref:DUF397 domain-containing protein n=1 Tax=Actinomadura adrarensis TaxID=1819600 RepID=A0ABW3CR05_9ACTN